MSERDRGLTGHGRVDATVGMVAREARRIEKLEAKLKAVRKEMAEVTNERDLLRLQLETSAKLVQDLEGRQTKALERLAAIEDYARALMDAKQ